MYYNLVTLKNIKYLYFIIIFDVFPEFEVIITGVRIKKSFLKPYYDCNLFNLSRF